MGKFFFWDEMEAQAKSQQAKADQMNQWLKQMFNQYILPQIQQEQTNQAMIQPWRTEALGWLDNMKVGGTTPFSFLNAPVGNASMSLPAARDWEQPFTPEELTRLTEPAELNADNLARQMGSAMQSDLARRGLTNSSIGSMSTVAPMGWLAGQRAQLGANALMMQKQRGDQLYNENMQRALTVEDMNRARRGESQANFWNLLNFAGGQGNPAQTMGNYLPMFQQQANQYGQNSQNWANSAMNSWGGMLGSLGNLLGFGLGGGFKSGGGSSQGIAPGMQQNSFPMSGGFSPSTWWGGMPNFSTKLNFGP